MGLNSSKLETIRAKLSQQSTSSQEQANAPQSIQQVATSVQAGKASVVASLVSLEASKATIATKQSLITETVETAGTINFQRISDSVEELKAAIHQAHPRMPQLLHDIWSTLHSYPEQVTLLSEEQMEVVFSGLEKIVDTDLAAITLKSATKSGGKKQAITTASLGF